MSARPLEAAQNFRGVNRLGDQQMIDARHLFLAQNMYAATRGIAETRLGTRKLNTTAHAGATRGRTIIRYYPATGDARTVVAMNVSGADLLAYWDSGTDSFVEITGGSVLSTNKNYHFTVYQAGLYMGNATEYIQKSTNGTTKADVTTLPKGYPGPVYRNRMTMWGVTGAKKRVYYTDTFGEQCDITVQYRSVEHPEDVSAVSVFGRDEDRGVFGDLAIFTPTSTWIQRGEFGSIIDGTETWDRATDRIGCPSPHTLRDTPWGLVGLGYDGSDEFTVFIIPIGGGRPIVISDAIRTSEALPAAYRHLASAVFYRGFYRVSFVPGNATQPTKEWWADLRNFNLSAANLGIDWWGPMDGRTLGGYTVLDNVADTNQLYSVDGAEGSIHQLDESGTYKDNGVAYTAIVECKSLDGGNPIYMKSVRGYVVGALAEREESVQIQVKVDEGIVSVTQEDTIGVTATPVGDGTLVGDATIVGGTFFEEIAQRLGTPLYGHRVSLRLTYSGGRRLAVKRMVPLVISSRRITV